MKRNVIQDEQCEVCGEPETTGHIFWSCPRAWEVWRCTKLHFSFDPSIVRSFLDLLWNMLMSGSYDEHKVAMVVTIGWGIWCNRNEIGNGGRKKSGKEIV